MRISEEEEDQEPLISMRDSPCSRRANAFRSATARISHIRALEVFPQEIQITWGGGPCCSSRRMKSASLLIRMASASRAAWKIWASVASRKPRARTDEAFTSGKLRLIQAAIAGESWASIQIFTQRPLDDRFCCGHRE